MSIYEGCFYEEIQKLVEKKTIGSLSEVFRGRVFQEEMRDILEGSHAALTISPLDGGVITLGDSDILIKLEDRLIAALEYCDEKEDVEATEEYAELLERVAKKARAHAKTLSA